MKKRIMQTICILLGMAALMLMANQADAKTYGINVREETLKIQGLKKEYRLFLIGDSHISLCDERDKSVMEKAARRKRDFWNESHKPAAGVFQKMIQESNQRKADLAIFAGDIMDSAMYASIDFVQGQFQKLKCPYLYILGNHDFEYGKEYFSKEAYRKYFPRLESLTGTKEQYCIQEFEDFLVVGLNDKNNQFDKKAVKAVLPVLRGDKPVILVIHVPLQPLNQDSALEQQANDVWGLSQKGRCRVLIGETACVPNKATQKLLDAVFAKDSRVAAVLAGHIHFYNQSLLKEGLTQYVTDAAYHGGAVMLHLTP